MSQPKEFPLSKQEAQVLTEAWHSRRASALLDLSGTGLNAGFQEDLVNAARRMGGLSGAAWALPLRPQWRGDAGSTVDP
ncbi:hypothetical protein OGV25_16355 [Pseudomonas sp. P1B16]|uniref:hypothetical protein n=1 Tax=Pseudomonas sp. P1B16 TaxID=2986074 RepID=UPI002A2487D1|nr:hypothetical protein [Pseudomonas sp. P1B16]WPM24894.1 hypothetical protein OGV25_16355 [Pseudomonas sp. P1B16]